jgi:hypothetical protein
VPMPDQSSRLDPSARWRSPKAENRQELVIKSSSVCHWLGKDCGQAVQKSNTEKQHIFLPENTIEAKRPPEGGLLIDFPRLNRRAGC